MNWEQLIEYIFTPENGAIMVGAGGLIHSIAKLWPQVKGHRHTARVEPIAAILICSVAVWLPGIRPEDEQAGPRIVLGVILGFFTMGVHKIVKQTVLGKDERIQGNGKAKAP